MTKNEIGFDQNILDAVADVLLRQLNVARDQIIPDASIMGDLSADSLDIMEITMTLEERFDLTLPDEQLDDLMTVGDLCRALTAWLDRTGRTV